MFLQDNLAVLRVLDRGFYDRLCDSKPDSRLAIVKGPSGVPALKLLGPRQVYLHSLYNPEQEARRFVEAQSIQKGHHVLVYGFGLGYHVQELLDRVGPDGKVEVFQLGMSFFKTALMTRDLTGLFRDPRLHLYITDDMVLFLDHFKKGISKIFSEKGRFLVHKNSLLLIPPEASHVKDVLEEWLVKIDTANYMDDLLEENYKQNEGRLDEWVPVSRFFGQFTGTPFFVISAGPSLDNALIMLNRAKKLGILICVGTALKPLLNSGVVPHFTVAIDPQLIVKKQFEGISHYPPLIFFPTVSPEVINNYPGPKIYALKKGWAVTEDKAGELGVLTVESGGSVATAALDIAVQMGGNPVVLVGQDLAFPDGKTHADGTIYDGWRYEFELGKKVINNAGQLVTTLKSLNIYRKWIENYIRIQKATGRTVEFINTALYGARIEGTKVAALADLLNKLERHERADCDPIGKRISNLLKGLS